MLIVGQTSTAASLPSQDIPQPPTREERTTLSWRAATGANPETARPESASLIPWSRLAFQSFRDGNWEIYVGNDDGTAQSRLTYSADADIHPSLNRGATRIAYAARLGDYEICVMNTDGQGNVQLTNNEADDVYPTWSPDGTRIALQSYRDGQPEIYVMQADGTGEVRLTTSADYDGEPAWSPDGSRLVFISRRTGQYHLWVMNADGSGQTQLSLQSNSANPTWSPDGSQIAYDADGNGDGWQELWVMNADGSNQRQVFAAGASTDAWAGSWSPDGRYVAFTLISFIYYQGNWYWTTAYLRAWDSDTGGLYNLSPAAEEWNPDWQTVDTAAPVSSLASLTAGSPAPVAVSWSGSDLGAAGLRGYDVQVKDGVAGTWTDWLLLTPNTSGGYPGLGGHTYYFRARAWDNAGNVEAWPADAEAMTTVEALPPNSAVRALPDLARGQVTVSWTGNDPGHSGIQAFDVQNRSGLAGSWTDWRMNTTATSGQFSGTAGVTYYFRSRARDQAQNVEAWPSGDDSHVTFYSWRITGSIHDNAGAPVGNAQFAVVPAPVSATASSRAGDYAGYGVQGPSVYTATWSKPGYGSLPLTAFSAAHDAQRQVALPPLDDVVRDGDFESEELGSAGWQAWGTLPVSITGTRYHIGEAAVLLGETFEAPAWGEVEAPGPANFGYGPNSRTGLVVDSRGVVHALWNGPYHALQYAYKSPGATWTQPITISGSLPAWTLDVAIDWADNIHVVWSAEEVYYMVKPADGNWSSPAVVPGVPAVYGPSRIAADGAGNVHLVFFAQVFGANSRSVLYTRLAGDTWAPPSVVAVDGSLPSLAVDRQGTVHLFWCVTEPNGSRTVHYASKPAGGSWTPSSQVSSGYARQPAAAVDSTGTLHAVWQLTGATAALEYRSKPADVGWTVPYTWGAAWDIYDPLIAVSGDRVGVAYSELPFDGVSAELFYAEWVPGGNLLEPVQMSPAEYFSVEASLFVESDGGRHLLWFEANPTGQVLYRGPVPIEQAGEAGVAQELTIPITMSTPTLSFFYQLGGASSLSGSGLQVQLQTLTETIDLLSARTDTADWDFASLDLSAWAGQPITVAFSINQIAETAPAWALLDDITLGSAYADVGVSATAVAVYPGELATYTLTYENPGGAAAEDVRLTFDLPEGLTYVSASVAPDTLSPDLVWSLGTLSAKTGPVTITVTARAASNLAVGSTLTHSATIQTDSSELEILNNAMQGITTIPYFTVLMPVIRR